MDEKRSGGYRSLFWPLLLIGIGVIALLANFGVLTRANIVVLFRLWPLLLILIGIDILFGRRSPIIGGLIGVVALALVIGLMLAGPSLGWGEDAELKTERFVEAIGEAAQARVTLDLSSSRTTVYTLSDSPNLIEADLTHTGEIDFEVQGDRDKTVRLAQQSQSAWFWFDWLQSEEKERWSIGLSPQVPLDLQIDGGSGPSTLELRDLRLAALNLSVGSGSTQVELGEAGGRYNVQLDGGSGSCDLRVEEGVDVDLEVDVGSGSFTINIGADADVAVRINGGSGSLSVAVPENAAARLDVRDSGSGSVRVPSQWEQTRSGDDDEGTWETASYGSAERQIEIVIEDLGSGSVEIR
jgi:hypothetical protein